MSKHKRGGGADDLYNTHLYGQRFNRNTNVLTQRVRERMYVRILGELATNRFKWTGFPESVDVRFLEMTLFRQALSVFYFDKRYNKYMALQGGGTNWVNMMDNPVGFSVIGANFVGMNISARNETEKAGIAVPIWANYMRVPDWDIVLTYSQRLAHLDHTIDINSENARQSKILVMNENQRLSINNINRQIEEGVNGIQVNGPIQDMEFVKALDLGVNPDSIEKLHILRMRIWNECMGLLGIENANQDKKERLVADEVDANNDQTSMMRYVNLNARRMACERIKEVYDLDITVEYHTDVERKALASIENATAEMSL